MVRPAEGAPVVVDLEGRRVFKVSRGWGCSGCEGRKNSSTGIPSYICSWCSNSRAKTPSSINSPENQRCSSRPNPVLIFLSGNLGPPFPRPPRSRCPRTIPTPLQYKADNLRRTTAPRVFNVWTTRSAVTRRRDNLWEVNGFDRRHPKFAERLACPPVKTPRNITKNTRCIWKLPFVCIPVCKLSQAASSGVERRPRKLDTSRPFLNRRSWGNVYSWYWTQKLCSTCREDSPCYTVASAQRSGREACGGQERAEETNGDSRA